MTLGKYELEGRAATEGRPYRAADHSSVICTSPTRQGEREMVAIPEGHFFMGCDTGAENERPVHRVWVSAFAIGRCAVVNQLYSLFLDEAERETPPGWSDVRFNHPDQPVTSVSWFDAAAYSEWLSVRTRTGYRLPT